MTILAKQLARAPQLLVKFLAPSKDFKCEKCDRLLFARETYESHDYRKPIRFHLKPGIRFPQRCGPVVEVRE